MFYCLRTIRCRYSGVGARRVEQCGHEHAGTGRVGVFLTDLNATVKLADGSSSALHVKAGDVSWSAPVTHATTNLDPNKLEMIVVEVY